MESAVSVVASYQARQQAPLAPEPLAGLAQIALLKGEPEQALAIIKPFLPAMIEGKLQGPDRLLWIYQVCYQVLAANHDPRASEMIQAAHQILTQRATTIADEKRRQSYMTGVSENNEIAQIWQTFIKGH